MPIYEYSCKYCGHEIEQLQSIREDPLVDCPSCMEPGLYKKLSVAAFHLKGTGWYETDFKNKDSKKADKSKDREAESVGTGNGEQKSDADSSTAKGTASESNTKQKNVDSSAASSASA